MNQDISRNRFLQYLSGDASPISASSNDPQRSTDKQTVAPKHDVELLDAYSQAVIGVVRSVSPALVGISGSKVSARGGSGSGFIVSPDGFALTNSHVVSHRKRLVARTNDGDLLDAELIGDDPATDLALVKIAAKDLPSVELGDSDALQVGQLVIALGDPLGLHATVSTGIVSAMGRSLRGEEGRLIESVIQHTAPLNPGNSGGPLVNTHGKVIGVNTAIIALSQGLGFSIPSSTARWVASELTQFGIVRRPFLGVTGSTVAISNLLVRQLDLLSSTAVEVIEVRRGGPAAQAGIQAGDILYSIQGRLIDSVDSLHRILSALNPSLEACLEIIRDGRLIEVSARLRANTNS